MDFRKAATLIGLFTATFLCTAFCATAEESEALNAPSVPLVSGIVVIDEPVEAFKTPFTWKEPSAKVANITAADPWSFGWTQILTSFGLLVTIVIAAVSFKTFAKWKREKLEEKRLDIALEALAIAYETRYVFEGIRSPGSSSSEWADLSVSDQKKKDAAGPFYAILKRIDYNKDYFSRLWSLQPRFMAVFGKDTSDYFMELHRARRAIEVSAGMLMREKIDGEKYQNDFREKLEADIWDLGGLRPDKVGKRLDAFVSGMEKSCLPIVIHGYSTGASAPWKRAYSWCVEKLTSTKLQLQASESR
jgi:hypothetical protein